MKKEIILAIILFILGFIGILFIPGMEIPIPAETEELLKAMYTDRQIQLLMLVNPTIMLIIAVVVGTLLYQKAQLGVPVIETLITKAKLSDIEWKKLLVYGIIGGIVVGIFLIINEQLFVKLLPEEFALLGEGIKPKLGARIFYGGITEEILMRFGLMSFMVWIFSLIFKKRVQLKYWLGIIVAAIIFALGHFPVVYNAIENPSGMLLTYIILGNSAGGVVFGWLYWKRGLESAFLAHAFAHLTMMLVATILG